MSILDKLFAKRGITDVTKLDDNERITFDKWQKVLSEGEITVSKIQEFCKMQLGLIEGKFKDTTRTTQQTERLVIAHSIYKALLDSMEKPARERESMEKYLQQLIESEN